MDGEAEPLHHNLESNTTDTHNSEPNRPTSSQNSEPIKLQHQYETSSLVKFSVFVGIFLVRILDGLPWIWGNLGVYVTSYYYVNGDDSSASSTNWLIGIDNLAFSLGLMLGGLSAKKIGIRLTLFFSIIVFNGSIAVSYFTLKYSAIALCTTLAALSGIGGGTIESCQLILIVRWTNRYQGLSSSSVPSSNILGAVAMNLILTLFINPYNKAPNATKDNVNIFTQSDLINRVPYSLVLYGVMSFTLSIVGFFLIRINREDDSLAFQLYTWCKTVLCSSEKKDRIDLGFKNKSSVTGYESLRDIQHRKRLRHNTETESKTTPLITIDNDVKADNCDLHVTPKEALKTRAFYVLCILNTCLNYAFFILNTYYKAFGLLYIPDDHFLTVVVMVKCFVTPVCTWIAGYCVDRFGVKPTMVGVASIFCGVASFFYLTTVDRWLYMFSTVLYGCALFSLFCLSASCCVKHYGQLHFSTILGMVLTSSNILVLFTPSLSQWIISTQGWLFLFSSVGVLAFCQVILSVIGLPEKQPF